MSEVSYIVFIHKVFFLVLISYTVTDIQYSDILHLHLFGCR